MYSTKPTVNLPNVELKSTNEKPIFPLLTLHCSIGRIKEMKIYTLRWMKSECFRLLKTNVHAIFMIKMMFIYVNRVANTKWYITCNWKNQWMSTIIMIMNYLPLVHNIRNLIFFLRFKYVILRKNILMPTCNVTQHTLLEKSTISK